MLSWTLSQPSESACSWSLIRRLQEYEQFKQAAEDLDLGEVWFQQRPVLLERVFLDVPGVVGLLGTLRRERQQVRSRDVGDRCELREAGEQGVGVLDVLDRLEEHNDVARHVE